MAIRGLTLIGESFNDSIPSTRRLFEAGDVDGIQALARRQDEGGADYIDVNVGQRSPEFMANVVRDIQAVTGKPLSIDTPDPTMAKAALLAYDANRAGGRAPILNSVSALRVGTLDLGKVVPFRPILLASERRSGDGGVANRTADEVYQTAREMLAEAAKRGFAPGDCLIDPAVCPLAADSEGHLRRVLDAMRKIHADPALAGVHISVGLSNLTVQLPPARKDGAPTRNPLENAFLTLAVPLGLDHVIGSVKRTYEFLPADHPAMACLRDCLRLQGFESILRVQEFYAG